MKYRAFAFVVLGTLSIILLCVWLGLFRGIEATLSDRLFSPRETDSRVLIVAIDDASLQTLGQWPLPRATIARGLEKIISGAPQVVGVDIIFAEPSRLGASDDAQLEALLAQSTTPIVLPVEALALERQTDGNWYTSTVLSTRTLFHTEHVRLGHINLIKDRDGLVRSFPPLITTPKGNLTSFTNQITGISRTQNTERIVWSGAPGTVPSISFNDLLDPAFDTRIFKDAYVLVGATAANLHDTQTTPVSAGTPMAGVEIQAQIVSMLLNDLSLTPLSLPGLLIWISILTLGAALPFFMIRSIAPAIAVTLLLLAGNLVAIVILFERGIAVDIVYTTLTILIASLASFTIRYFILERERREIRGVFSKYVSGAVLEELLKDPSAVKLGGIETEVTVFFSDIRGFTSFSEKLSPSELTTLLNRYLTRMTNIILEEKGVVDKYIGDAIMAFWGAPLKDPLHTHRAIVSSLAMLDALDTLNAERPDEQTPLINIGIGLNTGTVIVGNMGSEQRFDYTIMGDTVNLGSRIEGQTKAYGVRLLASEMTIRAYERTGISDPRVQYREIDKVTVKGKKEPVALYEIIERSRQTFVRSIHDDFETLRTHYYNGEWSPCIALGRTILSQGDDGPTRVLLTRAEHFAAHPPTGWRGVYELTSK